MSDLPPLKMSDEKVNAILQAINEVISLPDSFKPGDLTAFEIARTYGVKTSKARAMMDEVAKNNPCIKKVLVTLPETYHSRPGYVLRFVGDNDSGDHKGTPPTSLI